MTTRTEQTDVLVIGGGGGNSAGRARQNSAARNRQRGTISKQAACGIAAGASAALTTYSPHPAGKAAGVAGAAATGYFCS